MAVTILAKQLKNSVLNLPGPMGCRVIQICILAALRPGATVEDFETHFRIKLC
jgi:hypothetical protein